jgi:hypothetical protein
MENLQIVDLNRLGEWAYENEIIIKSKVSKAIPVTGLGGL